MEGYSKHPWRQRNDLGEGSCAVWRSVIRLRSNIREKKHVANSLKARGIVISEEQRESVKNEASKRRTTFGKGKL